MRMFKASKLYSFIVFNKYFFCKIIWYKKNLSNIIYYYYKYYYQNHAKSDKKLSAILKKKGIVQSTFTDIFSDTKDQEIYLRVLHEALSLQDQAAKLLKSPELYTNHLGRTVLIREPYSSDHPFLEFATSEKIIAIAAKYLGMYPRLTSLQLSWSYNFPGEEEGAYLWHKDDDDLLQIKVILYLNDVTLKSGPFCYVPESHYFGALNMKNPNSANHYKTDVEMSTVFCNKSEYVNAIGPAGTIVLADTSGYHRGLKPQGEERLALFAQYTTSANRYPLVPILKGEEHSTPDKNFRRLLFG